MRFAAIDLGTVTCRLLVADVVCGRVVPVAKEYRIVNLGEGVDVTHRLSLAALSRTKDALADFLRVRDGFNVPSDPIISTVCVATSASRDAENSAELEAIFADLGLDVQVISGMREAELTFLGASSVFPGERLIVVDVGGGSTEIVFGTADQVASAHSYDIGSRRITERFLHSDPPSASELEQARQCIREALLSTAQSQEILRLLDDSASEGFSGKSKASAGKCAGENEGQVRLVAVAGTATSVVSVRERMLEYDSSRVHGAIISADELALITCELASVALHEREQIIGLDPKRAPVIVAGLVILQEVMRLYRQASFTVSESDILSGIIISEYEKAGRAA